MQQDSMPRKSHSPIFSGWLGPPQMNDKWAEVLCAILTHTITVSVVTGTGLLWFKREENNSTFSSIIQLCAANILKSSFTKDLYNYSNDSNCNCIIQHQHHSHPLYQEALMFACSRHWSLQSVQPFIETAVIAMVTQEIWDIFHLLALVSV